MVSSEKTALWDALANYQRRHPESVNPPSERIDPDIPGSYLWVIIVTHWNKMHPLIQDVLYVWYIALSKQKGVNIEELDPTSTEALVKRFEELDSKLKAFEVERTNLEQELMIRDRDFQILRSITGKKEKENIEVQQMLGKSFQEKIMTKQQELEEKEEAIRLLEEKLANLEKGISEHPVINEQKILDLQKQVDERTKLLKETSEKLKQLNQLVVSQKQTINELKEEIRKKDEKIIEIKGLLKG